MPSRRSLIEELRWSLEAIGDLPPGEPLYAAHLGLVLTALARRVDELERRLDATEAGDG